jgi:hypothetical protein
VIVPEGGERRLVHAWTRRLLNDGRSSFIFNVGKSGGVVVYSVESI